MKNIFICALSFVLLFLFSSGVFSQDLDNMQVKTVSKNLIVANKGKSQGIQINAVYNINREGQIIGRAKVLLIEDNLCGLKILKLQPGFYVKLGDILVKNSNSSGKENKEGYIYRPPRFDYCLKLENVHKTAKKLTDIQCFSVNLSS